MPPKVRPKKKATGYQMPEKFDEGFVLKDVFKVSWTLGKPIGQGGFGLIYLASKGEFKLKNTDEARFVVKIEPKDNGPLFCETHFYANTAKEDEIKRFMTKKGFKHLGIPRYISTGLCIYKEKEYRFLVMDRYKRDLQSFLNESPAHQICEVGVLCLMRQIIYTLEYIHSYGYAHGDIKGANIMLKSDSELYLVDYGLVVRFERDGQRQKYQIKPERRHNGTIEYTSRDAHDGAQINRRSDMEILGYCVIHWLSGSLPWIDLISNNEKVQQSKIKCMSNVKEFISTAFKEVSNVSVTTKDFIEFYLNEVNKLDYDSEPDYSKIYSKISDALKSLGHTSQIDNFGLFNKNMALKEIKLRQQTEKKSILEKEENRSNDNTKEKSKNLQELEQETVEKRSQNVVKAKNNLNYYEDSDDQNEDYFEFKPKDSKKSRKATTQSSEISSKPELKQINGKRASDQSEMRYKVSSRVVDQNEQEFEDQSIKRVLQKEHSNKSQTSTNLNKNKINDEIKITSSTANYNAAQLDLLSRMNQSNLSSNYNLLLKPPMSPLALESVTSVLTNSIDRIQENKNCLLVKKRRDVIKSTVGTQTDKSCIRSLRNS